MGWDDEMGSQEKAAIEGLTLIRKKWPIDKAVKR